MKATSTTHPSLLLNKLSAMIAIIFLLIAGNLQASPTTTASIGDFVWVDQNGNGLQDSGEPGLAGVTVNLLNSAGTVVATTTTNSLGKYMLTNVSVPTCGQYRIQFGTPGQYTFTTRNSAGTSAVDNSDADANGYTIFFTLCPGDYTTCIDAGIIKSTAGTVTIGDFVFVDTNANGIQDSGEPGVAGVTVNLLNSNGTVVASATTNASGLYQISTQISSCGQYRIQFGTPGQYTFTTRNASGSTPTDNSDADANGYTIMFTLCPGDYTNCIDAGIIRSSPGTVCIGDFVFVDTNSNGIQDSGEPGVAGVKVNLLNSAGGVVGTATTNASGIYKITAQISSCGQYRIQFGTPGQYTFTTRNANGSTATDNSDADANGYTIFFTLCPGDYTTCIDAGVLPKASIGDFVFDDKNKNGIQDADDFGVPRVQVSLLNSAGAVVATTTTSATGFYSFSNIAITTCGQYRVQFGSSTQQLIFTTKDAPGSNDANDSDANPNGITDPFTICPGTNNTTIDAGTTSQGTLAISIQFKGSYTNGVANLTWKTASEVSPATFEVERSADGSNFKTISATVINSKGVQAGSTYNFNDNLPLAGNNYYRVKIKENGNYHYSNIITLNVVIKGINITGIYPNPFINRIKINVVSESAAPITVTVNDFMGRTISTQKIQGQKGSNEIFVENLGSLTKGIYNLQVTTGAQTKSIKLMKD